MKDLKVIDSSNANYVQNKEEKKRITNVCLQASTQGMHVDIGK